MFYETKHSSKSNYVVFFKHPSINFDFPLHLHENYEFLYVEEGQMRVTVHHCEFDVCGGEGVLILPNQPHGFSTPEYCKSWIIIFSSDHIPELKRITAEQGLFHPVIRPGIDGLHGRLCDVEQDPLRLRSILYELAACYCDGEPAPQLAVKDRSLICKIVEYIDHHYTEEISLEQMSKALGYHYRYMSVMVNQFFHLPFPKVINRYRVNLACDLLAHSDKDITQIAYLCGFGSLRNFNRNFKVIMGITPREYQQGHHKSV